MWAESYLIQWLPLTIIFHTNALRQETEIAQSIFLLFLLFPLFPYLFYTTTSLTGPMSHTHVLESDEAWSTCLYFPFPSLMLSQSEHLSCQHREHFDEPVTAVPHLQQHHMMPVLVAVDSSLFCCLLCLVSIFFDDRLG